MISSTGEASRYISKSRWPAVPLGGWAYLSQLLDHFWSDRPLNSCTVSPWSSSRFVQSTHVAAYLGHLTFHSINLRRQSFRPDQSDPLHNIEFSRNGEHSATMSLSPLSTAVLAHCASPLCQCSRGLGVCVT